MSKTDALKFLKAHHLGVLSTVNDKSEPWGSTIVYTCDDDLNCYFVTRADTLKYKNIADNPMVALTITELEEQRTLQLRGKVSRVPASDYIDVVFNKLAKANFHDQTWVPPVMKVHKGDYMVLCITPSKLQYADFKQKKTDAFDEYIEQII